MLILYNIFEKKYCVTKKICNFTFVLWINVKYQQKRKRKCLKKTLIKSKITKQKHPQK